MRVFIAGDSWSGLGPANVTYQLIKEMPAGTRYLKSGNRFIRLAKQVIYTLSSNVIVYSGFSAQSLIVFFIARIFKKPSFYLIHGNIEYEGRLNEDLNLKLVNKERKMFELANYILAVSEPFENWLKNQYPEYKDKIYHLTNGIDWNQMPSSENMDKEKNLILSIGGGVPQKNILTICMAINQIYEEQPECGIKLIVLGSDGLHSEEIKKYSFVDYQGIVSHEQVLELMCRTSLYVQTSVFESFGLALIEALLCGCSIVASRDIGALSILDALKADDIITDCYDINEVKSKILHVLQYPNQNRLKKSIDKANTSVKYRVEELLTLIKKLGGIPNE